MIEHGRDGLPAGRQAVFAEYLADLGLEDGFRDGRQVLCVTHLAPIAVHATHHLVVEKRVAKGSTRTSVTPLPEGGRVEELARMLGGERVTDASRRHARELLRAAQA